MRFLQTMSKKAIGIYLGEKYAAVAYKDKSVRIIQTGANNEDFCRSCVAMDRSGYFIVGNSVYNSWKRHAPNIVTSIRQLLGVSINDDIVKRIKADKDSYPFGIQKLSGGTEDDIAIILQGKEYTPEQICAALLHTLKNDASNKLGDVEYAVITVPAYYNQKQTTAIRKAAKLAGFKSVWLLVEPVAAVISFDFNKLSNQEEKVFLVYDFSENSVDLTILVLTDGLFLECCSGGDHWFGGDSIDAILSDYVKEQIESINNINLHNLLNSKTDKERNGFVGNLKTDVENAKKALSQNTSATIYVSNYLEDENDDPIDDVVITRDTFEALIRPLIQRTIDLVEELLANNSISADDLSNILLVGSASCIPLVKKMLDEKYGTKKVLSSEKPMFAIAQGAAIFAESLDVTKWMDDKDDSVVDYESTLFVPDTPVITAKHNYYIQLQGNGMEEFNKIIDENTPLPYENHLFFIVDKPNQSIINYKLFSDAEDGTFEKLGEVYFLIEKGFPLNNRLSITFCLDENETLTVRASLDSVKRPIRVILGRGNRDSSCCDFLMNKWQESLSDNIRGQEMRSKIQEVIKDIILSNPRSDDPKWYLYEQQISRI